MKIDNLIKILQDAKAKGTKDVIYYANYDYGEDIDTEVLSDLKERYLKAYESGCYHKSRYSSFEDFIQKEGLASYDDSVLVLTM